MTDIPPLNLDLITEYSRIICECDIRLTEPNPNKKEINATKKRIKNDIKNIRIDLFLEYLNCKREFEI